MLKSSCVFFVVAVLLVGCFLKFVLVFFFFSHLLCGVVLVGSLSDIKNTLETSQTDCPVFVRSSEFY